ncbi:MAG TPA: helix-turn-helix domain-containing protein [Thermomicrobiales bacterium]|nr:helix-turn-helix domain-containing protein [Thermomicrobiales bacterium]
MLSVTARAGRPAGGAEAPGGGPRLRADARRNRDRILAAARDVFAEQGPGAPLEEIARRAGVGIATLYRRFPDRQALARGVALDVWRRVAREAEQALAEEPDAFRALARYLHRALDLRTGAVLPALAGQAPLDDEARRARDQSAAWIQRLVDAARAEGTLRPDVAFGDTGLLLIRLGRPLPGPFPRALDDALAHRHLDLLLDGLRAAGDRPDPLPGPALTREDLHAMFPEAP